MSTPTPHEPAPQHPTAGPVPQHPTAGAEPQHPTPSVPPITRDDSLADGEWHRMHPLTPLLKGGLALIIVAGIAANNFRDRLIAWFVEQFTPDEVHIDDYAGGDPVDWVLANNLILVALGGVLAVVVVLSVIFWLIWRFQEFRVTGEHVEVRKGIVFRTHRRAPLDRVQGVNLTRPFLARLIGLAKLEVVGAGNDSNVPLEYLSTAKAESVRADILRLASGARAVRQAAREAARRGENAPAAASLRRQLVGELNAGVNGIIEGVDLADVTPESVVKIPTGRLVGSQVVSGVLWFVFFAVIYAVTMGAIVISAVADGEPMNAALSLGIALAVGIPMLLATVAVVWAQISRSLRYSIAPTPDGVRITYGLLTTVTETIPPGRIFAVEVSQSLLWRPFGWWQIKIDRMTGKSAAQQSSSSAQQFNVALPVGTRADVERVLELLLPDMPADDRALVWEHGILGPREQDPYEVLQPRGWWRRPVSWKRHGFALTDFGLLMRRGAVWRKLAVFPLARLQGISASQGPIDRMQRLASLKAHSITGPILGDVVGIERDAAVAAIDEIARRAAAAAVRDRSHRWAQEAGAVAASASASVADAAAEAGASPEVGASADADAAAAADGRDEA